MNRMSIVEVRRAPEEWRVRKVGESRPRRRYAGRERAVSFAWNLARDLAPSRLIVHGEGGVELTRTFGPPVHPPRQHGYDDYPADFGSLPHHEGTAPGEHGPR